MRFPFARLVRRPRRTPIVLQMETAECGAAALAILLRYYGRFDSLADLRFACGVSRDGARASDIITAGRERGLSMRGYRVVSLTDADVTYPCIALWRSHHFLVVEGIRNGAVEVNDPARGRRTIPLPDWQRNFSNVIVEAEPGEDFEPSDTRKSTLGALLGHLQGQRREAIIVSVVSSVLLVPPLALADLSRRFVDQVLIGHDAGAGTLLAVAFAITVLIHLWLTATRLSRVADLEVTQSDRLARRFIDHLVALPLRFFAHRYGGEVNARVKTTLRISNYTSIQLTQALQDGVAIVGITICMLVYSTVLTAVVFTFSALIGMAYQLLAAQRLEAVRLLAHERGQRTAMSLGGLRALDSIRAGGLEKAFLDRWTAINRSVARTTFRLSVATRCLAVVPDTILGLAIVVVLALGAQQVAAGTQSSGTLIAIQALILSIYAPTNRLMRTIAQLQPIQGHLDRLDDALDTPAETVTPLRNVHHVPEGRLELKAVTIRYAPIAPPVVQDLSLRLDPGEWVALVGPSGAGKSTVGKACAGLLPDVDGQILIDGLPIEILDRSHLARGLHWLDQETHLFAGTLRDNLSLWTPTSDDQKMWAVLEDVCLADAVRRRPLELDCAVAENGRNFSGGERQRIQIARALCAHPRLLIMDEATSALDVDREAAILAAIKATGASVVLITHRDRLIGHCDKVVRLGPRLWVPASEPEERA